MYIMHIDEQYNTSYVYVEYIQNIKGIRINIFISYYPFLAENRYTRPTVGNGWEKKGGRGKKEGGKKGKNGLHHTNGL